MKQKLEQNIEFQCTFDHSLSIVIVNIACIMLGKIFDSIYLAVQYCLHLKKCGDGPATSFCRSMGICQYS